MHEAGYMEDISGVLKHPDRVMVDTHVFFFVKSGEINVVENGQHYQIKEGEYLFLHKGLRHWGKACYAENTKWYYIHFYDTPTDSVETSALPEYRPYQPTSIIKKDVYLHKLSLPKHGLIQQPALFLLQLDKIIEQTAYAEVFSPLMLSQLSYQLFLELYQQSKKDKTNSRQGKIVTKITTFCREAKTKATAADISEHLNMNYAYLSTIFREETGKSIRQFQNELLIERAIKLFNETDLNIGQVSDQLGFANPFYFSRVFKKVIGISPSSYINQRY